MSIAASIFAAELEHVARLAYVGSQFEVALVNSPGITFSPTDSLSTVLAHEVSGSGYSRQTFSYASGDLQGYTTNGLPLARKAATFTHNGGTGAYSLTHVVVVRVQGSGSSITRTLAAVVPLAGGGASLVDGNQCVVYFDATAWRVVV